MAKTPTAAQPAPEPEAAPAPVAVVAPAAPEMSLNEACALFSDRRRPGVKPAGLALLAAFNFEEEQAGRLFDTEAAYRERLAAFAARPATA